MNEFFRSFVGVNFVCFGAMSVPGSFNLINGSIDWEIKTYVFAVILAFYATSIVIPFGFANSVTGAVIFFFQSP